MKKHLQLFTFVVAGLTATFAQLAAQTPMSGEASIVYEGVTYPCDKPPYTGGAISDESKYERKMVGGMEQYEHIKTGKRKLKLLLNDTKNKQNLVISIYFDGTTGEKTATASTGNDQQWAGESLSGKHTATVNITSIKQVEEYKYMVSGTFEKDVVSERRLTMGKKYHFTGQFNDLVIQDMEDPKITRAIQQHAPEAFDKAADEMKKDAEKRATKKSN